MTASDQDTIVAIATAPGKGGIGVVRLSGNKAHAIAQKITGKNTALKPRHAGFAAFHDADNQVIDEGLLLYFPGPNSFTGEDVVELQGHGGPVVLDQVVQRCLQLGARQANAGEFSLRAFLNDKMDLTQAEAIADLIDATSAASARAAVSSLQGRFSAQVNVLVEALIQLRIYVEAAIDFPEEEIDFLSDGHVAKALGELLAKLNILLQNAHQGRLLQEGIKVVLAGKPNAGKSSLLNALAGFDSAIVTDIAGTTRDVLREKIVLGGLTLNLVDTAGLRHSDDPVEQEGIRRARQEMAQADLLLLLVDSTKISAGALDVDTLLDNADDIALVKKLPTLVLLNKQDLLEQPLPKNIPENTMPVSAKTGSGLAELKARIEKTVGFEQVQEGQYSARRRHLQALQQALAVLEKGRDQLEQHRAGELLAEDLRHAQKALEEITGAFSADDLLGRIFSSFCIGK